MIQKNNWFKAVVAIAVALAFIMPTTTFANGRAIRITPNIEKTNNIEINIEKNSDIEAIAEKIISDNNDIENIIDNIETSINNDDRYKPDNNNPAIIIKETTGATMLTGVTIYVDDDRPPEWYDATHVKTIQEGVNNATAGDTVYIYNGIYYEHVTVNKQVDLVGEDKENVIVDGSGVDNVFYVLANYASINNFTITNGRIGIWIESANNNVSNIICYNHFYTGFNIVLGSSSNGNYLNCEVYNCTAMGIRLYYQVSYNNFINCTSHNNGQQGIYLYRSPYNNFVNCYFYNNTGDGMYLDQSNNNNNLTNCKFYQNSGWGVNFVTSYYNTLANNEIYANKYPILVTGYQYIDTSNTVNGKPIYYLINNSNITLDETDNVGYLGLVSCSNITVSNSDVYGCYLLSTSISSLSNISSHDSSDGVYLESSSNNNIINCIFYNNTNDGIYLNPSSSYNTITNCNTYNNKYGVYIEGPYNTITSTHVYSNSNYGIYIYSSSSHDIIINNCISNNNGLDGIYLYQSSYCNITYSSFYNNTQHGMDIFYLSNYNTIKNCNSYNNNGYGCYIYYNSYNKFKNSNFYSNTYGFYIYRSANTFLQYNTIYNNLYNFAIRGSSTSEFYEDIDPTNYINGKPIWYIMDQSDMVFDETHSIGYLALISCTNITVKNSGTNGVMLVNTTNSILFNVSCHNAMYGIYLFQSKNNNITSCESYNNSYGLYFYYSPNNILRDSSLHDNIISNLYIYGGISDYYLDIDTSNTVNGKLIYYLINNSDITLDETNDVGYLGLISCNNITLKNSDIWGAVLIQTSYSTMLNVNSHNDIYGVYTLSSSNNNFINCVCHNNMYYGFYLKSSSYSNFVNITCYGNSGYFLSSGIYLESSSYNNITDTTCYNNSIRAITLSSSSMYNNVINSNCYGSQDSLYIDNSPNNNIINCSSYSNSRIGLFIRNSANNNVINCEFYNNTENGIYIGYPANYNKIIGCVSYNSKYGVYLVDSTGNEFIDSSFYNNSIDGVLLSHGYSSNITNCLFYNNTQHGIYIQLSSTGNIFTNSSFYNNNFGVYFSGTSGNLIHHNNFVGNTINACGMGGSSNTWDDNAEGNFWGDYTGIDADGNGIGDTPYYIPGGDNDQDNYPLMAPILSVQLLSPEDGSTIENLKPTFDWADVEPLYTVTYTLQVATDPSFEESTLVINETGLEESEYTPSEPMAENVYYWRVNAIVGIYDTDWSEIWCFIVNLEDTLPPTTTHEFNGTLGDNSWYVSDVSIELTAEDDLAGVKFTYYKIDGDEWQEYNGIFLVTEDGMHNLSYYSVDYVGNEESVKGPFGFKIDKTVPTINLTVVKIGLSKWRLIADVSDNTSGIARVEFYLDGVLLGTVTASPYEWNCTHKGTAKAIVYDNAGNNEVSNDVPVSVNVDLSSQSVTNNHVVPGSQSQSSTSGQSQSISSTLQRLIILR